MAKCFIAFSCSVILVLIWDALMYSQLLFMRYSVATYLSTAHLENKYSRIVADVCYCLLFLSFPLGIRRCVYALDCLRSVSITSKVYLTATVTTIL